MKKTLSVVIALIVLLLLSSCTSERIKIEDRAWKMRYAMHGEDDKLIIDAVDKEDETHPEAKLTDITLTARDGKITITDSTNDKTYEGTYSVESRTLREINYKITIDGREGYATVAMTTYADGSEEPTLPINLGEYSLYFYAE